MKTQLIQLDPSDDTLSVRDKMGWSQTSRILLIWPDHGQILTRRLDLVLLQRHSTNLGAQIALVTHSPKIREIAKDLHLPVFETARQAQNTRWRSIRRRQLLPFRRNPSPDLVDLRTQLRRTTPKWQEHPVARITLFGISLGALVVLILYVIPTAHITLHPETRTQSVTLPVAAGSGFSTVNLAGELPATLQSVVVEGRDQIPTSGSLLIPGESAVGAVQLTNLTSEPVSIPAGLIITTLEAEPVRFTTTRAGTIVAGPGSSMTIPVQAVIPGERGNLPPASLTAIEGELGLSLSATNLYPTHGGTSVLAPAPSERDRQALLDRLTETLQGSALTDLQNSLGEGDLLISTTLKLTDALEEMYSPTTGLPGNTLGLTLRLEFQALVVNGSDLQALVGPVLDGSLPSGYIPLDGTQVLRHSSFSALDEDETVHWIITASRSLQADIQTGTVIQIALGQPVEIVSTRLTANLPLANTPAVELSPNWWPRLPYLPFRIQVTTP